MQPTLPLLTALLLAPLTAPRAADISLLLASLTALHGADAPPASVARVSGPAVNLLPNPSFEEKEGDGVKSWKSRAWAGKKRPVERRNAFFRAGRTAWLQKAEGTQSAGKSDAEAWKVAFFKKHPQADTNHDGVLSWPEYKAYKAKLDAEKAKKASP